MNEWEENADKCVLNAYCCCCSRKLYMSLLSLSSFLSRSLPLALFLAVYLYVLVLVKQ